MTPKEKSYAKMTLNNRMSQLQENSDSAGHENTKNLYYAPNIKALRLAINIINAMPDEDSIDVVVTLLTDLKDKMLDNSEGLENIETSNKILSVIDYLLASL